MFALLASAAGLKAKDNFQNLRLVWTTTPQTHATISWESDMKTEGDYLILWEEGNEPLRISATSTKAYTPSQGKEKKGKKKKKDEEASVDEEPWYYRHVRIQGLMPSTVYHLTAHSDGQESAQFHFRTAPNDDRNFKLIYVGDSRSNIDVAETISTQLGEMAAKDPEILAAIHGGDFASRGTVSHWRPWLAAWERTTSENGRLLPIIPVVGNHEDISRSPVYSEAYDMPGGNENFLYSCKLAPNFRIAVLNSEIPSTGVQESFLKETLERYKSEKVRWQLVAFHRPVYPAVKKPGMLQRLVPHFESYNIDLVLESDGHCIKRTVPIRNNEQDPSGVVYLGEGGYGAPQRDPKDLWYLEAPGFASKGDHLMLLRVTPEKIEYKTIGMNASVLDQFDFFPRKR
ncbi:MAG: metallophosphoesterase family protein [Opitutales bacterium]